MPQQETLKHSKAGLSQSLVWITASFPQSWWHKVLFALSECLWWVRGLILNAIASFLLSCCGFSFDLGYGFFFFFWVGFNILLLMVVQQLVVILMFSKEKVSLRASTLPSWNRSLSFSWVLWELSVKCLDTDPSKCSLNLDYHCIWLLGRAF